MPDTLMAEGIATLEKVRRHPHFSKKNGIASYRESVVTCRVKRRVSWSKRSIWAVAGIRL